MLIPAYRDRSQSSTVVAGHHDWRRQLTRRVVNMN